VESIGILASQVGAGADNGSAIGVFVKPLFEALSEQNRSLQVGAALCLARVIDLARDPPPATLQRLCPRIVKLLSSPNFLAKSSLLTVVGSLAQVCKLACKLFLTGSVLEPVIYNVKSTSCRISLGKFTGHKLESVLLFMMFHVREARTS
jgi:hypothetical protein